jgi:hypothetical protein
MTSPWRFEALSDLVANSFARVGTIVAFAVAVPSRRSMRSFRPSPARGAQAARTVG